MAQDSTYAVHKFLFDLRHDSLVAERFRTDPASVASAYALSIQQVDAIAHQRYDELYAMELNPYLLYFGALELGVSRDSYYESIRRGESET